MKALFLSSSRSLSMRDSSGTRTARPRARRRAPPPAPAPGAACSCWSADPGRAASRAARAEARRADRGADRKENVRPSSDSLRPVGAQSRDGAMDDGADVGFAETGQPGDRPVGQTGAVLEREQFALAVRQLGEEPRESLDVGAKHRLLFGRG